MGKIGVVLTFSLLVLIFVIIYWESSSVHITRREIFKPNLNKTVLVTGANSNYFGGLLNLIGSIHFWEPDRLIVVYNLGLNKRELSDLSNICGVQVQWLSGIPPYLPPHAKRLKQYAWKEFAIKDALDHYDKIFWMDGGSDVRAPMNKLDEDLEKDGFFVITNGKGGLKKLLHQGMYDYLKLKREDYMEKDEFQGGYQGYIKGSYGYINIFLRTLKCAGDENCISPPGSSLQNHRYDQSALSLMVHSSGINMTSSQMHYDVESFQRNQFEPNPEIPSKRFIYTGRASTAYYKKYIRLYCVIEQLDE